VDCEIRLVDMRRLFVGWFYAAGLSWDEREVCRVIADLDWADRDAYEIFGLVANKCLVRDIAEICGMSRGKWILFFVLGCKVQTYDEWNHVMGLISPPNQPYDAAKYGVLDIANIKTLDLVLFVIKGAALLRTYHIPQSVVIDILERGFVEFGVEFICARWLLSADGHLIDALRIPDGRVVSVAALVSRYSTSSEMHYFWRRSRYVKMLTWHRYSQVVCRDLPGCRDLAAIFRMFLLCMGRAGVHVTAELAYDVFEMVRLF